MGKIVTSDGEVHMVCTQTENIAKLNLVLLGNGNPENGIAFKVLRMADSHELIKDDISEIKDSIGKLVSSYDESFKLASTVNSAFERYKAECAQFEAGKQTQTTSRNNKASRWLQTAAVVIASVMMIFGYINIKRDSDTLNTKFTEIEMSPAFKTITAPVVDTLIHK